MRNRFKEFDIFSKLDFLSIQIRIIVTWWSGPGGIQTLSERPTGFLQCFDIVGLVIWPVKTRPRYDL